MSNILVSNTINTLYGDRTTLRGTSHINHYPQLWSYVLYLKSLVLNSAITEMFCALFIINLGSFIKILAIFFQRFTTPHALFSIAYHSSEIRGLSTRKCSSETLQKLLYFMYKKSRIVFVCFSFCATLLFPLMNVLVYVDIILWGIPKGKNKVVQNDKQKKTHGFSYT